LSAWKEIFHALFPCVVDTKHLSASCAAGRFASTALGDLYRELVERGAGGGITPSPPCLFCMVNH
jgi:hypothetical protein